VWYMLSEATRGISLGRGHDVAHMYRSIGPGRPVGIVGRPVGIVGPGRPVYVRARIYVFLFLGSSSD
jgi:hypothetical protein